MCRRQFVNHAPNAVGLAALDDLERGGAVEEASDGGTSAWTFVRTNGSNCIELTIANVEFTHVIWVDKHADI
jgi:hypothetical protein